MSSITLPSASPRTSLSGPAALGGLGFLVAGAIVAVEGPSGGTYETTTAYVTDVAFMTALVATALALVALNGAIGAPTHAIRAAMAGQVLLSLGVLAGVALGEDPGWFGAIAGPAILLTLYGTVRIGVHAFRNRALPRAAAILLALTVPLAIAPGGEAGGGVIIGALWLWLAARPRPTAAERGTRAGRG